MDWVGVFCFVDSDFRFCVDIPLCGGKYYSGQVSAQNRAILASQVSTVAKNRSQTYCWVHQSGEMVAMKRPWEPFTCDREDIASKRDGSGRDCILAKEG